LVRSPTAPNTTSVHGGAGTAPVVAAPASVVVITVFFHRNAPF
jgi:hypothetical protein